MITQYFDINQRLIIQAPGTLAPASLQPWGYGDNYNLAIYLVGNGIIQTIGTGDSLQLMLFQPAASLPEQNLAIISAPVVKTDPAGYTYYQINVNLATTQLANLVQATNTPAKCQFHYIFTPATGERFSSSADIAVTVNPDPSQSAAGGTPVPPGYPSNPNVFEYIANKGIANGYAGLDAAIHLNPVQIPTDTTLAVTAGKLGVSVSGSGNPYVAVITASFAIPAEGVTTGTLTLAAASPDILANEIITITDGVSFIFGIVATISGTSLTVTNNGPPGAVTGTMGANAHIYMGSTPGPVDTLKRGTTQKLPTTNPTKLLYRGDDSWQQANYPDLLNVPTTFAPTVHGSQHLSGGSDPVALATAGASGIAGLCPPPDGTTINVTGGKLTAIIPAGTQPYVATTAASFVIPGAGSGNTFTLSLTAAWADLVAGMSLLVSDGSHTVNLFVQSGSGTSWTVYNLGGGTLAGATMAAGAHIYLAVSQANPVLHGASHNGGADPIALATSGAAGLCPQLDGTTINISASKLSAVLATTTTAGIVKPDGTTITISGGTISSAAALGAHGCRIHNSVNIALSSSLQVLTFDTNDWDTDGFHSTTTNPSRITIPTGQSGYYVVGASVLFTSSSTGTYRRVAIKYNGGANQYLAAQSIANIANDGNCSCSCITHLNAGAYIEIELAQDGTSLNAVAAYLNVPSFYILRVA